MKTINTSKAPAAIGPYSQGKIVGNIAYLSGQIPIDPLSGNINGTTIEEQTACVISNIAALLEEVGADFENVIKTTCFLADIADFAAFNAVYAKSFTGNPARSCVAVRDLPKGVLVEIEVTAELV